MTRLFVRIWVLMVVMVIVALTVETIILVVGDPESDGAAVAHQMRGGALLARRMVREQRPSRAQPDATLAELSETFGHRVAITTRPPPVASVDGQMYGWYRDTLEPMAAISMGTDRWLQFGPMPAITYGSLSATVVRLLVIVLTLSGLLFLILRRVRRRLGALEVAAAGMADGDLTVRVPVFAQTETAALAQAFNRMAERVHASVAARERLLSAVSHELRTPITRIQLGLHLLDVTDLDVFLGQIDAIEHDLEAMTALIQQLLETARIDHAFERQSVEIDGLLSEIIAAQTLGAHPQIERGATLNGGQWPVDSAAFSRAIGNIIGNARRFATARIRVDAWRTPTHLHVAVDDDGPGIAEADRVRVFEPFARLSRDTSGYGLGLALVRAATRAHDGEAWIESNAWGGCRVVTRWAA